MALAVIKNGAAAAPTAPALPGALPLVAEAPGIGVKALRDSDSSTTAAVALLVVGVGAGVIATLATVTVEVVATSGTGERAGRTCTAASAVASSLLTAALCSSVGVAQLTSVEVSESVLGESLTTSLESTALTLVTSPSVLNVTFVATGVVIMCSTTGFTGLTKLFAGEEGPLELSSGQTSGFFRSGFRLRSSVVLPGDFLLDTLGDIELLLSLRFRSTTTEVETGRPLPLAMPRPPSAGAPPLPPRPPGPPRSNVLPPVRVVNLDALIAFIRALSTSSTACFCSVNLNMSVKVLT